MRIVYVDKKYSIEEPEARYPTLVDAIAALDRLFKDGLCSFGQILSNDGFVLRNVVPDSSPCAAVKQETTAQPA